MKKRESKMGDFIKELSIIDFIGIIIPGGLLVLLVAGDQTAMLLWESLFGSDCNEFTRGLFLLIAGYVVGMVLHEIGDMIEKGMWCMPWFDPKAYAVFAVGPDKLANAIKNVTIKPENVDSRSFSILKPKFKGWAGIIGMVAALFSAICLFGCAMECTCQTLPNIGRENAVTFCATIVSYLFFFLVIIIGLFLRSIFMAQDCSADTKLKNDDGTFFQSREEVDGASKDIADLHNPSDATKKGSIRKRFSPFNVRNLHDNLESIAFVCQINPEIQTCLVGYGNVSKRTLYDGFRYVMRNLIICLAVVNLYSIWIPIDLYKLICSYFLSKGGDVSGDFFWLNFWEAAVVVIMFVRYYHYTFLRYKYTYEDFLKKSREQENEIVTKSRIAAIRVQIEEVNVQNTQVDSLQQ